jgi:CubicO group peptidase (beta-lactamase class C family)
MRRIIACVLFTAALPVWAGVGDDPEVKGAERLFESWIMGQIAYRNLPGAVVGVVHDQELTWAKGFGYADVDARTPMTPATLFRMASHSKLFTATAIMQLRDAGKIHLDDTVSTYLPWFRIQPANADDPGITIEELLTHSSGLPREAGAHWTELSFPDAEGIQSFIKDHTAAYAPEVRFKYSNLGFTIAGMVVEAVSGEKWSDYVRRHIFDPLGMASSSVDKDVAGLATGYGKRMPDGSRAKMPFVDARAMAPATGITSNVEDMARFVSLQFRQGKPGGNQILSTGALRIMHRVRMMENNWQSGNAIGFAVRREHDKVYIGHGGSYFGYKTQTYMQMDPKVGVIVLTNGDDSNPAEIAMHLMQLVGEAVAKAGAAPAKNVPWDPSWSRFSGRYRSRIGGEVEVIELNKRLVTIDPSGPFPENPNQLVPLGNGLFRLEASSGGGPVGETVRFTEENGKVTRMYTGGSYSERVPDQK